jgi:GntR family transcriptional repressor for pyruvate dehydrogenase complex
MFCGTLPPVTIAPYRLGAVVDPDVGVGARSRADWLASSIDERIRTEGLAPGTLLGTLTSLRTETGLAKATVSEAVRLLRDRGLVEIRPGRTGGLFVADSSPVVRLRHTLLSVAEEPTAVVDAIELRDHLELLIDLGAAACRSGADVVELRAILGKMRRAADWNSFMQENWALHRRIAAICPNGMARGVYAGTLGHISSSSARLADDEESSAAYRSHRYAVHAELVEAIASGDVDRVHAAADRHNTSSRTDRPEPT